MGSRQFIVLQPYMGDNPEVSDMSCLVKPRMTPLNVESMSYQWPLAVNDAGHSPVVSFATFSNSKVQICPSRINAPPLSLSHCQFSTYNTLFEYTIRSLKM